MGRNSLLTICLQYLLVQLVVGFSSPAPDVDNVTPEEWAKECQRETDVGVLVGPNTYEHKLRCFDKCMAVKRGFVSESGKFNTTRFMEFIADLEDPRYGHKLPTPEELETCLAIEESDLCQKVYLVRQCAHEKVNPIDAKISKAMRVCLKAYGNKNPPKGPNCIGVCASEKSGWMNSDGSLNIDVIRTDRIIPDDDTLFDKCLSNVEKSEKCQRALEVGSCVNDAVLRRMNSDANN